MKACLAFLLVNGFFLAVNGLAAAAFLGFGALLPNSLREDPLAWLAIGLAAVAIGICAALWLTRFISRPRG